MCHGGTSGAVPETPGAPGRGPGPKTQTLSSHHPGSLFPKPWNLQGDEAAFTHLDFVPVVSVLLQHAGRVQRGLRHHRGLLEGHARRLEPAGTWGQAHHRLPQPSSQAQMRKPRLRELKEPGGGRRWGSATHLWPSPRRPEPSPACLAALLATPPTTGGAHVDPGVVHELRDGQALRGVRLQQEADQLLGWERARRGEGTEFLEASPPSRPRHHKLPTS